MAFATLLCLLSCLICLGTANGMTTICLSEQQLTVGEAKGAVGRFWETCLDFATLHFYYYNNNNYYYYYYNNNNNYYNLAILHFCNCY